MNIKWNEQFEIRVGIIGNVSAGKTTGLNALLRGKFSEVAMKRTTAGINNFRIFPYVGPKNKVKSFDKIPDTTQEAKKTLNEITEDNARLRTTDSIEEKTFDIETEKELVPMGDDTILVLVDFPGINEAGTYNKYKDAVTEKWQSLDCVIVVMDGKQGVNTEDQVSILELVKKNQAEKKNIPIIILCNKIDDPADEEHAEMVCETQKKVERIFGVECRELALANIMELDDPTNNNTIENNNGVSPSPAFIPVSLEQAYVFQSASVMDLETFKKFDKKLMDKFGREMVGRLKWPKIKPEEKAETLFETIISDPEEYKQGLEASNFDKFMKVLQYFVGGKDKQLDLVINQIEFTLKSLMETGSLESSLMSQIKSIYDHTILLKKAYKPSLESCMKIDTLLTKTFWTVHARVEDMVYKNLEVDKEWYTALDSLSFPLLELKAYYKLVTSAGFSEEAELVIEKMGKFVRRYFGFLLEKEYAKDQELNPIDWALIWNSILVMSHNKIFCGQFVMEKVFFELHAQQAVMRDNTIGKISCPESSDSCVGSLIYSSGSGNDTQYNCDTCGRFWYKNDVDRFPFMNQSLKLTYDKNNGYLVPVNKAKYDKVIHVVVPKTLTDPKHFGYIVNEYCSLIEHANHTGAVLESDKE